MRPAPGISRRTALGRVGAVGALAAALLLSACAPSPEPTPEPTTSKPAPKPSPDPTAEPAPEPEAQWERFSDPRTIGSFEVAPGRSVVESERSEPEHEIFVFDVFDETGELQLRYARKVMGLGGGCGGDENGPDETSFLTVTDLEVVPVEIPGYVRYSGALPGTTPTQFTYRALESAHADGVFATMAVSDTSLGAPYCFYYNLVQTESALVQFADTLQVSISDAPKHFDTMDEARAFMQTEDYEKAKRMLLSLRLDG